MYAFPLKIKETTYKLFKFGKVVWAKKSLHFENVLFWAKTDINLQTKQNRHCSRGGEVGRRRRVIKFICNCINCSTVLQTKTIKIRPSQRFYNPPNKTTWGWMHSDTCLCLHCFLNHACTSLYTCPTRNPKHLPLPPNKLPNMPPTISNTCPPKLPKASPHNPSNHFLF